MLSVISCPWVSFSMSPGVCCLIACVQNIPPAGDDLYCLIGGAITSEEFVEDVTLEVSINEVFTDQLKAELSDITKGAAEFV